MTAVHNFKKGDKASHTGELLTFQYMDGAYARWENEKGEPRIGQYNDYEEKEGIFYPVK